MENTNVRHLNNPLSVAHRVAVIIKDLPPGHSRNEAFNLINAAGIKDAKGNPISASMFYHQLCRVPATGGKPRIHEFNPNFVPTLTDNPRTATTGDVPKRAYDTRGVRITKKQAARILATLMDMKNDFDHRFGMVYETMSKYMAAAPDADDESATTATTATENRTEPASSDAPQTVTAESPGETKAEPKSDEHKEAPKRPAAKAVTNLKKASGPHKRKSA